MGQGADHDKPSYFRMSLKNKFDAISFFVAARAMAPDYLDNPVKYRRPFAFQRLNEVVLD